MVGKCVRMKMEEPMLVGWEINSWPNSSIGKNICMDHSDLGFESYSGFDLFEVLP